MVEGRSDTFKGALWMGSSLLSLAMMAIAGRELAGDLTTFEIMFWRSLVSLTLIAAVLTRSGWGQVRTASFKVHAIRSVTHFGAQFCWIFAIAMIPLVEVFALEFTSPIWVAAMAAIFLGERLTTARVLAVVLGFAGVMVVLQPGIGTIGLGSLAALGSAIGYATTHVTTRLLAQRDTALCVLFYMTAIQMPLGLAAALTDWHWPETATWPWIVVVGLASMGAHYTMTRAMSLIEVTVAGPMGFLRLPLIAAVGYLFYGEALELAVIIGAALICSGIFLNLRDAERR